MNPGDAPMIRSWKEVLATAIVLAAISWGAGFAASTAPDRPER